MFEESGDEESIKGKKTKKSKAKKTTFPDNEPVSFLCIFSMWSNIEYCHSTS